MRFFRKLKRRILEPEQSKKLDTWKDRLEKSKTAYGSELSAMKTYADYYDGTRNVNGNPKSTKGASKVSVNVRNIV